MPKLAIFAILISAALCAAAQPAPPRPVDPYDGERMLVARRQYDEAIKRLEERMKSGECRGAVCDTLLAIAHSKVQKPGRAAEHAEKAVETIADEPLLKDWEANDLGVILFRAPQRTKSQLSAAAKAFRFARVHYKGRGSNIVFNLKETLQALGEQSEASALQRELDARFMIDPRLAILGDFQGVTIERR